MKLLTTLLFLTFICNYICQVNDSNEHINSFPWIVSIRFGFFGEFRYVCSGVIISDIFVLTAANCFDRVSNLFSLFSIRAGVHNFSDEIKPTEQLRRVSQIIIHPNYTVNKSLNNLALVRVAQPFNITSFIVSTIQLSNLTSLEYMDLLTIRWDYIRNQSNSSIISVFLQEIIVQEDIECTRNKSVNPLTQLCAVGDCQRDSDSGSPLVIYSNNTQQYELVGITSFRNVCMSEGLFTRLAPFVDWILQILADPPFLSTISTMAPITVPTPKPNSLGPPIPFVCNTSYSCGCSSIPVIFHDEPPFLSTHYRIQPRIVGGENAQPHSWPWIVLLKKFNTNFCSGTLLNQEWVLTAAHCMNDIDEITVHIGVHNQTSITSQPRNITKVIIHPNYEPPPRHINDIALFRLSLPVNLTLYEDYAGITCLPPKAVEVDYPTVGTILATIGWGRLTHNGARPQVLQQVRVQRIANNDTRCLGSIFDQQRQFCAMVDGGGKDTCQGDSGGPIHQWVGDHWIQVGIVSFGKRCAEAENPGIYTRLSFYYDWINSNTNETGPITYGSIATTTIPYSTTAANIIEINYFFISISSSIICVYFIY